MNTKSTSVSPPTQEEIETVRQELHDKLMIAENQPLYEKRNAQEVFAEKRELLEELLSARV